MELIAGIIAVSLLVMLVYLLYSALKDGLYLLLYRFGLQKAFVKNTDLDRISGYLHNSPYYRHLSPEGQRKFIDRLLTFMLNKEFKGAKGLIVTEEMKVLISASAVQLTFGLEKFKLQNLETIYIFPTIFKLMDPTQLYKGATSPKGIMYLSWQSFQEGNRDATDKVNLGLHEMTHALKLSLSHGAGFDSYFANRIDLWEHMAQGELKKLREKAQEFLRSYGKVNMSEFFPVCVEAFFESPKEFSTQLPQLYQYIVFLLNQDPNNAAEDYKIKQGYFESNHFTIPIPTKVRPSYKYNSWHWSLSLLLFGVLGGLISVPLFFTSFLILPTEFYFISFLIVGTLGLLQKRYFEERKILSGSFFLLYSYIGFGVSLVTIILWINFLIPISEDRAEEFTINSISRVYKQKSKSRNTYFAGFQLAIEGEGSEWYNDNLLLVESPPAEKQHRLVVIYRYGLFGVKIFKGYYYKL
jgi:hypothetical protein